MIWNDNFVTLFSGYSPLAIFSEQLPFPKVLLGVHVQQIAPTSSAACKLLHPCFAIRRAGAVKNASLFQAI